MSDGQEGEKKVVLVVVVGGVFIYSWVFLLKTGESRLEFIQVCSDLWNI